MHEEPFFFVNSPKCVVYCLAAKQYEATVLADLLVFRKNAVNFSMSIIAVSFHSFCYDSKTNRQKVTSVLVVAFRSSTRFTIRFCSSSGGSGMGKSTNLFQMILSTVVPDFL